MLPPQPPKGHAPLFGRDTELEHLRRLHRLTVETGRGRCAQLTGPTGIGKSRLMEVFRVELRRAQEVVLEGRCRKTDRRPFGSMVELLGQAAEAMADLGRVAPATERALSLLSGIPQGVDPGAPLHRDDARLRFFEAVRLAVLELTSGRSPVLFLHDLHRADVATIGLLRYLIENLLTDPAFDWTLPELDRGPAPGFDALLVLSFREVETTRPLLELTRVSSAVEHLPLHGLDRRGLIAFLQSDAFVERIEQATGGNPAALEQVARSIVGHPEALFATAFDDLDVEARALLDALAVFARPIGPEPLRELARLEGNILPLVARLTGRGLLVRRLDQGEFRLQFARTALRDAYDLQLPDDHRRELHLRMAERLVPMAGLGVEAEEVASHYLQAGRPAEAIPFVVAAAERLVSAHAYPRAAELLALVLPSATGSLRLELLDRAAEAQTLAGDFASARETLCERLSEANTEHEAATLEGRLAQLELWAGAPEQALKHAERALSRGGDDALPQTWHALAAEAAWQISDAQGALRHCEEGDRANAPVTTDALKLRNTRGKVMLARGAFAEARAIFASNLVDAERLGDVAHQTRARINLGIVQLGTGETEAAASQFETALVLAERAGDLRNLALALDNLAVLHHRSQAFSPALDLYHRASSVFRRLGNIAQLAHTALNLADLHLVVGDLERATRLVDIGRSHIRRARLRHLEAQCAVLEGELARESGASGAAIESFRTAIALVDSPDHGGVTLGPLLCSLCESLLSAEEPTEFNALLTRLEALQSSTPEAPFGVRVHLIRAQLALRAGDAPSAVTLARAASTMAERTGDREAQWRAVFAIGIAQWSRGDHPAAIEAIMLATEIIARVGRALPETLRQIYLDAPLRVAVHLALRRTRAGLPPLGERDPTLRTLGLTPETRLSIGPTWRDDWPSRYPQLIGRAPTLYPVFHALDRVSGSDALVLIRGESGTGKELVAAALHAHSPRALGPFVKVNCSAFVETLLLSELFGHEKGSFTGAVTRKKGRFELADGGTLFLDEIGDISQNTQVALLRVLQEGAFERVGGTETVSVDVRVICATHRNLEEMVRRGEFRADLYYRLRGVVIELPPLRGRRADIPALVDHFLLLRRSRELGRLRMHPEAMASLLTHDWPGNVRELENVVRSATLFADGEVIGLDDLRQLGDFFRVPDEPAMLLLAELTQSPEPPSSDPRPTSPTPASRSEPPPPVPDDGALPLATPTGLDAFGEDWLERAIAQEGGLHELKKRIEYEAIVRALKASGGNITRAAERLGMKRPRLSQIIHAIPALNHLKGEVGES